MQMQKFTPVQWNAFAGASDWNDGALPLYCEERLDDGRNFILVLDATGGNLLVENDDEVNNAGGRCLDCPFPTQEAALAFARGIQPPYTVVGFLALGFAEV